MDIVEIRTPTAAVVVFLAALKRPHRHSRHLARLHHALTVVAVKIMVLLFAQQGAPAPAVQRTGMFSTEFLPVGTQLQRSS